MKIASGEIAVGTAERERLEHMKSETPVGCMVDGKELQVTGRFVKTVRLLSEAHVPLEDPVSFVEHVRASRLRGDIFTFVQGIHDRTPKYAFLQERDQLAVLPITTYDNWYSKTLYFKPRNKLKKALKSGIEYRLEEFSEPLILGIKAVYDETPIRQGKRNYHYKEDVDTIRRGHSRFLDRSQFITAYYEGEFIGFAKVTFSQGCGIFMNFASKISHRDKAVSNGLLAKAIEICAERKATSLVYGHWGSGGTPGLVEFKVANGFECVEIPRYYVPLTWLGKIGLQAGVHKSLAHRMPAWSVEAAAKVRKEWNKLRFGQAQAS
jgi:hypothetical protein